MTPQEAIVQVAALMIQLIERVKDNKTAGLVQQIQSLNQTIQAGYVAAEQKALDRQQEAFDANRKVLEMEDEHKKAIAALQESHRQEIARLNASNARPKGNELSEQTVEILKFFFDHAGEVSDPVIMERFQLAQSIVAYHLDILLQKKFIGITRPVESWQGSSPMMFQIFERGRKYIVENGLAG